MRKRRRTTSLTLKEAWSIAHDKRGPSNMRAWSIEHPTVVSDVEYRTETISAPAWTRGISDENAKNTRPTRAFETTTRTVAYRTCTLKGKDQGRSNRRKPLKHQGSSSIGGTMPPTLVDYRTKQAWTIVQSAPQPSRSCWTIGQSLLDYRTGMHGLSRTKPWTIGRGTVDYRTDPSPQTPTPVKPNHPAL